MPSVTPESPARRQLSVPSGALERTVLVDLYLPPAFPGAAPDLLLINDGQDLQRMGFGAILDHLYASDAVKPLVCAGIHAGLQRKQEYGTAGAPDYRSRGSLAARYTHFIAHELLPFIRQQLGGAGMGDCAFAGFSLGGLSALDISWSHPQLFRKTGVFSGSLWWRSLDQADPGYRDEQHRLMHSRIRAGRYQPGMKFFFECGTEDETEDRNHNGIIDSIDDTQDLIRELLQKGYAAGDIRYLEVPGGTHDPETWGRAMPDFLRWGWGTRQGSDIPAGPPR